MNKKVPYNRAELVGLLQSEPSLKSVFEQVCSKVAGTKDRAHDLAHLFRVAIWTCRFLGDETKTSDSIAAALLHDLVNVPKNHPDRALASQRSAEAANPILINAGFSAESIESILLAIRQHSFSRGESPTSALGMALQDADRLEALGSIGIMRAFSTGARMGSDYFHPEDPWAKTRPLDDKAYTLDHFFLKLLQLPETMNTPAGREEARERTRILLSFLESLEREMGEKQRRTGPEE